MNQKPYWMKYPAPVTHASVFVVKGDRADVSSWDYFGLLAT